MLTYIKDVIGQVASLVVRSIVARMRDSLIRRATMTPYSHLDDYMLRYWLVPYTNDDHGCGPVKFTQRPLAWVFQKLGIAIRIHCILRSDDDRAYHDHPWHFMSVILDGVYWEHRPIYDLGLFAGDACERFESGAVIFRRAGDLHRLELPTETPVWTLFITGPWKQHWGFIADPAYKKYWREYLHPEKATVPADEGLPPITIQVKTPEGSKVEDLVNIIEGNRMAWLMARCKECNGLTHASKWYLPKEAGVMTKERGKLEAEGRYPFSGVYAAGMAWCKCDEAADDARITAHRSL